VSLVNRALKIALISLTLLEFSNKLLKTYRLLQDNTNSASLKQAESKTGFLAKRAGQATFRDIIGFDSVKNELKSALEWPLKYNHLMKLYDLEPINGLCLFGPPGCGKTHFVRCAAGEFSATLYLLTPSNIGSVWYGQSEKRIRRVFEEASSNTPSIIAIDEADKIFPRSSSSSVHPRLVSELLQNMDGLMSGQSKPVVVLLTNEPWKLHDAILRRGRIDRIIYVPPPNYETRIALFKHFMSKVAKNVTMEVDFEELGKLTEPSDKGYYSSAAIKEICRTVKEEIFKERLNGSHDAKIDMRYFFISLLKVPPDIDRKLILKYEEWGRKKGTLFIESDYSQ
jgi:transitional endoplasmic reticulum ATPase